MTLIKALFIIIFLMGVVKGHNRCPSKGEEKAVKLSVSNNVLKCSIVSQEYIAFMVTVFRLYSWDKTPVMLAEFASDRMVDSFYFSQEHLKEGLGGKKVYCTYQYIQRNLSERCHEIASTIIEFGFTCPDIPNPYVMNQLLEIPLSLHNPPDLYCVRNRTSCPVRASIGFKNNLKTCRDRSQKQKTTPALLLHGGCKAQFNSNNWKSGLSLVVVKNTNYFISENIGVHNTVNINLFFEMDNKVFNCSKAIEVILRRNMQAMATCKSYTDPHIQAFYVHFTHLLEGEFLMYKNSFMNTEIRVKQRKCQYREKSLVKRTFSFWDIFLPPFDAIPLYDTVELEVGCNAAVSVQITDYVVVFSVADGILIEKDYRGKVVISQDDFNKWLNKSGSIIRKINERTKEVHLPNGDKINIYVEGIGYSLTVIIYSLPSNMNNVIGYCTIQVNENIDEAMKRYKIPEEQSNFNGIKDVSITRSTRKQVCLCGTLIPSCVDTLSYMGCGEY